MKLMQRRQRRNFLGIAGIVIILVAVTIVSIHHDQAHTSIAQRALTIESKLRAPGDPATVANSPLGVAQTMKYQVTQLLKQGLTNQQVLAAMERSYGSSILATPKFIGFGSMAWIAPWLALLIIAAGVVVFLRKTTLFGSGQSEGMNTDSLDQGDRTDLSKVQEKLKDFL